MKLNVYLARCGVASRRKSDELIKKGKVTINGRTVLEPFADVTESSDSVKVSGKTVGLQKMTYLALNKPLGYTCTLKDRFAEHKVTELIPPSMGKVFPAGRLDKNTSGLIILTTDGNFAQHLTHPSFEVEKEYEAEVSPLFDSRHLFLLRKGVAENGETLRASSGRIIRNFPKQDKSLISIVMKEGRKREVRRMFEKLRYSVLSLKRVRIGNVELGELEIGKYRQLTGQEIAFFCKRVSRKNIHEQHV
ncbi:MAG TPA: pseudouridine synthase [bacterium]|nr:pseudouridine synthase [bacterium]